MLAFIWAERSCKVEIKGIANTKAKAKAKSTRCSKGPVNEAYFWYGSLPWRRKIRKKLSVEVYGRLSSFAAVMAARQKQWGGPFLTSADDADVKLQLLESPVQ